MYVSKRSLGEGYIVATGVVLAAVLFAQILHSGSNRVLWMLMAATPALVLIAAVFWLQELDLDSDQVWVVAKYSSLGIGIGTVGLVLVELLTASEVATTAGSVLVGTTIGTMGVAGAFGGVVNCLRSSNQELDRQNNVLHRVLRHNLRNDMTVVMCLLDDIEANGDLETASTAREARDKVQSVVHLTDKVRQVSAGQSGQRRTRLPRDLSDTVETRVDELEAEYPQLDVATELPDTAQAYVDETFGLVVDNVVESAISAGKQSPTLTIQVTKGPDTVQLTIEDEQGTLPDADISAVAAGGETALEHGHGVELWLVDWLVEANDGSLVLETNDQRRRVAIELERARSGWLAGR